MRKHDIIVGLLLLLSLLFLPGSSCSKRIRCTISSDCPGSMVCGQRRYCILQCKSNRDCRENQRCVEGQCEALK